MTEESSPPNGDTVLESVVSTHITQDSTETTGIVTDNLADVRTDQTRNAIGSTNIWENLLLDDIELKRAEQTVAIPETKDIREHERNKDILDGDATKLEHHESEMRKQETSNVEELLPPPSCSPGGSKNKSWELKMGKKRKVSQTSFDFSPANTESKQGEEKRPRVPESETPRKMSIFQRFKQKFSRRKNKTKKKKETESSSDCLTFLKITNESKLPHNEDGTDESTNNDTLNKQFIAMKQVVENISETVENQTDGVTADCPLITLPAEDERELSTKPQGSIDMVENIKEVVISNSLERMSIPHDSTEVKLNAVNDECILYSTEKASKTELPNEGGIISECNEINQSEQKQCNDSNTGRTMQTFPDTSVPEKVIEKLKGELKRPLFSGTQSSCIAKYDDEFTRGQNISNETVQNKTNGLADEDAKYLKSDQTSELEDTTNWTTDVAKPSHDEFITDESTTDDTMNKQFIDMTRVVENSTEAVENQTTGEIAVCPLITRPAEDNADHERRLSTKLKGSTEMMEENIKDVISNSLERMPIHHDSTEVNLDAVNDKCIQHSTEKASKTELPIEDGILSECYEINQSEQKQCNDSNTGRTMQTFPNTSVPKKLIENLKDELKRPIYPGTQSSCITEYDDAFTTGQNISNETVQNKTNGLADADAKYLKSDQTSETEDTVNWTTDVAKPSRDEFITDENTTDDTVNKQFIDMTRVVENSTEAVENQKTGEIAVCPLITRPAEDNADHERRLSKKLQGNTENIKENIKVVISNGLERMSVPQDSTEVKLDAVNDKCILYSTEKASKTELPNEGGIISECNEINKSGQKQCNVSNTGRTMQTLTNTPIHNKMIENLKDELNRPIFPGTQSSCITEYDDEFTKGQNVCNETVQYQTNGIADADDKYLNSDQTSELEDTTNCTTDVANPSHDEFITDESTTDDTVNKQFIDMKSVAENITETLESQTTGEIAECPIITRPAEDSADHERRLSTKLQGSTEMIEENIKDVVISNSRERMPVFNDSAKVTIKVVNDPCILRSIKMKNKTGLPNEDAMISECNDSNTGKTTQTVPITSVPKQLIENLKDELKQPIFSGIQSAYATGPGNEFTKGQSISSETVTNKTNGLNEADDAECSKSDQRRELEDIMNWTTDVAKLTHDEFVSDEYTTTDTLDKHFIDTKRVIENITVIVENQTTDEIAECPLTTQPAENNAEHERGCSTRHKDSTEMMENIKDVAVSNRLDRIQIPHDRTKAKVKAVDDQCIPSSIKMANKGELPNEYDMISERKEINQSDQIKCNDSNTGRSKQIVPTISILKVIENLKEEQKRRIFSGTQSDSVNDPDDELRRGQSISNEAVQDKTNGLTEAADAKYLKSYQSSELDDILNLETDLATLTHDEFVETVCKLRKKIDHEENPEENEEYHFLTESEMTERLKTVQRHIRRDGRETYQNLVRLAAKQKKMREDRQVKVNQARTKQHTSKEEEDDKMVYYTPTGVIKLMRKMHYGGYMGRRYRFYLKIMEKREREEQEKLTQTRSNNISEKYFNDTSAEVFDEMTGDGKDGEKKETLHLETEELNTAGDSLKNFENEVSDGDCRGGDLQLSGDETTDEDEQPGKTLEDILVKHWNYDEKRERIIEKEWVSWETCTGFAVDPEVKKEPRQKIGRVERKFMMNKTRKSYYLGKERLNRSHNASVEDLKDYEFGDDVLSLLDEQTAARQDVWEVLKQLLLAAEVRCMDHSAYTDEFQLWQRKRRRHHLMLLY